ncbi:RnfABCDGE type electron transport complex subunit G [Pseudomonas sp. KK4]|uniref:RnfABCDGE type electron transport complex subunit G n=1 Tax=Pseudomonas sp. KK4 TaxID=1855729 RepID=UPI00097BB0EF|nr:RnfABCDGE type electron transport complex subunit G [Pseudomonas sp. KK4]
MNRGSSVFVLALLAALGIGLSYVAQYNSAPRIAAEQRLIDSDKLLDLLPRDSYDNLPLEQPLSLDDTALGTSTLQGGWRATRTGQATAVLLRSQTRGYAASIELLIAIDLNGRLLGVKTLEQTETPGLGARIAEWPNAWLSLFSGKSLVEPDDKGWALKKDQGQFDQIAGATITSRAVINATHDALRYFDTHRQSLLEGPSHE